jgi:ArsR family transcriptional regulator
MEQSTSEPSWAVLADPTRARLLRLMRASEGGRTLVGDLATALGLRQPTVSHHMKTLHDEGIVLREPSGRRVWYSINPEHAERVDAVVGVGLTPDDPAPDLARVAADLTERYRGTFNASTVARYVRESHELLARREHTPRITSRTATFATQRLDDLARTTRNSTDKPEVLFVCVQNAGRSQLAAGILRHLAGERVVVRTAGSAPANDLRASIVGVLDEVGVAIGGEFPKPLTDEAVRAADYVVTMGCGDACPLHPGKRYLDWDLDDPVDKPLDELRRIRDDVETRVRGLLDELELNEATMDS